MARVHPEVYFFGAGIAEGRSEMRNLLGDVKNPLLFSVRSGARVSMPGMMDTVLNLGLTDETVKGLVEDSGNERFAWDSYRRFCQMYGDVVLKLKPENKNDPDPFEELLDHKKSARGVTQDTDLKTEDLKGESVAPFIAEMPSGFGPLRAVIPSAVLSKTPAFWARPAMPLGSHPPRWPPGN